MTNLFKLAVRFEHKPSSISSLPVLSSAVHVEFASLTEV